MAEITSKPIRSPSYPNMPLREAVEAVRKIEGKYRSAPVDRVLAAKLIGYAGISGPANQALAALASYGLLERAGKGETRVTSRAIAIIYAENDAEKVENLLAAASEPDLYREIMERFSGLPVPPEEGVISYLNRQGFNPNAVRPAARAFLETMRYVEELRGSESHGVEESKAASSAAPDVKFGGAKVGDLVQWEAGGVLRMEKPMRVRLVSSDGQWVAVDGSETGIPMSEVIVHKRAPEGKPQPPMFPLGLGELESTPADYRKAVIPLDEGDVTMTYPRSLSSESTETLAAYLAIFFKREGSAAKKREDAIKALAATHEQQNLA